MAKKNKNASSKKAAPECTCDHPYNCSCGNRPPRPSKGHKWDAETKAWGGKGHKQKGASGQTASIAKEAVTTNVGKTKLEQWQRLPTKLLEEVCKREGRPRPKYKSLDNRKDPNLFLYRVIVQDAKASKRGTDHDIILVPSGGCKNEEQAKEEAALLALLHLTPSLPHERKLPEPYKTTWLSAIASEKSNKSLKSENKEPINEKTNDKKKPAGGAATATTNLKSANSYVSVADKRHQFLEKRKAQRERIRKHEAIRMANRDHQVFLSARARKQIEALLRGESSNQLQELLQQELEDNPQEFEDDDLVKAYVVERLVHEGFTSAQARAAYKQVQEKALGVQEDDWDRIHDESLQWLCIHLGEDDLPEGFDPRGGTLDVVLAPTTKKTTTKEATQDCTKFGISPEEAGLVLTKVEQSNSSPETILWKTFVEVSGLSAQDMNEETNRQENLEMTRDEMDALEAIFPQEECEITTSDDSTAVRIRLPQPDTESTMVLSIVVKNGLYPAVYPQSVLLTEGWTGTLEGLGGTIHVELLRFMSTLTSGEPMVYEIYGKIQELLLSATELTPLDLLPALGRGNLGSENEKPTETKNKPEPKANGVAPPAPKKKTSPTRTSQRRPRPRSFFWSKKPRESPPATPFPKLTATMERARKNLPAARARQEFLSALKRADKSGHVVLVTGATGSGKTTQIPQFILEESPVDAKIVVAQPRRIAATGVASRVANERGEAQAGTGSVGHVVRGDSAICNSTRLMFCTTGVLLRQLQCAKALDCITHLIVDEVHERHLDTDILLGVLKACLDKTPHLRLILMSATIDEDRFASYFGNDIPRMHIEGRTFPVTDFMLEDVLDATGYVPSKKGKKKHGGHNGGRRRWNDYYDDSDPEIDPVGFQSDNESNTGHASDRELPVIPSLEERVMRVDETKVDYDLVGQLVKHLIQTKECGNGSILVFLPGAPEINAALKTLQKMLRGISVRLLPLHGGLQPKDQNAVFQSAERGCTKVVLSTNIAETSITIEDCTIVIDSCREKQLSYDTSNRMPLLQETFASKSSLKQRRGRAGRVRAGTCYKLISRETMAKLQEHGEPEIRRCALDQTLLSLLFLGLEDGTGNFLRTLLDPPSRESIEAAIDSLDRLGAVATENSSCKASLTPLGMHLAGIPAPPTVGKICVLGCILGCRRAALSMAAGMSLGRNPFLRVNAFHRKRHTDNDDDSMEEVKQKNVLKERKQLMSAVGNSDHAMLAAAYINWENLGTGAGERKRYCEALGLNFNGMRDMKQLVSQLDSSLTNIGFHRDRGDDSSCSWNIVRACAVGALAPSQLVKMRRPSTKYTETVEGAVEREGDAKEIKLFIRGESDEQANGKKSARGEKSFGNSLGIHDQREPEKRVFIHPSSANFSIGSYECPWLVYHELVQTSKAFLRDSTECSSYSLLLFGGQLEVQASKGLIVVDKWVRLAANPRIGALVGGLRQKVDELLSKKVREPSFDIAATAEMKIIVNLLISDGLGH